MAAHAKPRLTVGPLAPYLLALVAAALLTPALLADRIVASPGDFRVDQPAPITVRVSPLAPSPLGTDGGAILVARGDALDVRQADYIRGIRGAGAGAWLGAFLALFALVAGWSHFLRSQQRGRLLRLQIVSLSVITALLLVASALMIATSVSIFAVPLAAVGLLIGRRSRRSIALASAALSACLVAALVPWEPGILAVLAVQALVPVLILPRHASLARTGIAALFTSAACVIAYALAYLAAWNTLPSLANPAHSTWLAAGLGPLLATALVQPMRPIYSFLCGDVSSPSLSKLERLSQPLLKQIADKSPGTWQHSLAMANLAEAAGAAIGADRQLLRVGAYYHDLGKSLQPKYYIENLKGGEPSVHENLSPCDSRDGIFQHVSEGIRVAREAGLPERIIDFIRSHHGAGVLEYFWTKHESSGANPEGQEHFRYPGNAPQCPETGIMCICDAVEGATRTLKTPSARDIEEIIDHIIFGKVRTGQLDQSGLSLKELLRIRDALCGVLIQAHAPAERKGQGVDAVSTAGASPAARARRSAPPSLAGLSSIRLDSLDRPSAQWNTQTVPRVSSDVALAQTESVDQGSGAEAIGFGVTEKLEGDALPTEQISRPTAAQAVGGALDNASVAQRAKPAEDASASSSSLTQTRTLGRPSPSSNPEPSRTPEASPRPEPTPQPGDELETEDGEEAETEDGEEPLLLLKRPGPGRERAASGAPRSRPAPEKGPPRPPPGSPPRETIPLGEGEPDILPASARASRRADSQDGLRPGEMVIGPPPSTHPERHARPPEEVTVQRPIPLPEEARRPEDRITEEQLALVPPEAYGEKTIPRTRRPGSESDAD